MMIRIRTLQLGAVILATVFATARAAGQEDVVGDHIRAIGGQEALSSIKTVKRSGSLELDGVFGQLSGDYTEAIVVGAKAYNKSDLGIAVEETAWNGTIGWKRDAAQGLRELDGYDLEQIRSQVDLDPIAAINRQYGRSAFIARDDEMIGNVKCHALGIVDVSLVFYIDVETKMLKAMKSTFEDPNLGEATIVFSFSDYADFGGVKMAQRVQLDIADGTITIDIKYEKTELNVTLDDSIFEKPTD